MKRVGGDYIHSRALSGFMLTLDVRSAACVGEGGREYAYPLQYKSAPEPSQQSNVNWAAVDPSKLPSTTSARSRTKAIEIILPCSSVQTHHESCSSVDIPVFNGPAAANYLYRPTIG